MSVGRESIGFHVVDILGGRIGRIDDVLPDAIVVRSGFRGRRVSLLTADRLTEVNLELYHTDELRAIAERVAGHQAPLGRACAAQTSVRVPPAARR